MDEIVKGIEKPAILIDFPKKPFRTLPLDALPGGVYARQSIELQNLAHSEEIERLYKKIKNRRLNNTMLLLVAVLAATSSAAAVTTVVMNLKGSLFP